MERDLRINFVTNLRCTIVSYVCRSPSFPIYLRSHPFCKKTPRRSTPGSLEIRCRIDRGAYFFRPAKCFLGFLASLPLQPLQQTATETVDLTAASTSLPLTGHFPSLALANLTSPAIGSLSKAALHFLKYHGKKVIITSIPCIKDALDGKAGTEIRNEA